ncbi:unnamed protein product [Didymodactylos carnosus]|uniref:Uncharacterized protein n=1 Tax=Didymodactylos carnosus TaxID=1234261 RepID=A0A814YB15_9BILA|nr:unnamed protein product [Didymodactylos carnosus]CAF1672237.1 unnamed protein product [Didymodactylos carnosus]CAF3990243.1 unnamed protein product [Didymodactylos carnosus]CAF4548243.1 unnamed protein product [Didymodactylos carnosus]
MQSYYSSSLLLRTSCNTVTFQDEQYQQQFQPLISSSSSTRLYRYSHEPLSTNLLRRDIPPILIILFFLFLVIITS